MTIAVASTARGVEPNSSRANANPATTISAAAKPSATSIEPVATFAAISTDGHPGVNAITR